MTDERIRIAAVTPIALRGERERENLAGCVERIREAAAAGARLVLFPECYPGPATAATVDANTRRRTIEAVSEAAVRHGCHVSVGWLEASENAAQGLYLVHCIISAEGRVVQRYRRSQPTPDALNERLYGARRLLAGDPVDPVELDGLRVGMTICSEIKVPELPRRQMLAGAELLLNPVGGLPGSQLVRGVDGAMVPFDQAKTRLWRAVAQTRAVENMMYVALATNAIADDAHWGACIASPEGMVAHCEGPGMALADLDLARLRALRARQWDDADFAPTSPLYPVFTDPGQQLDRRPELYRPLVDPQSDAVRYHRE